MNDEVMINVDAALLLKRQFTEDLLCVGSYRYTFSNLYNLQSRYSCPHFIDEQIQA